MNNKELKPCPCGKIPSNLVIIDSNQGGKWALTYGDCCAEWNIEFRTQYYDINSDECMRLAIADWNNAPRGTPENEKCD